MKTLRTRSFALLILLLVTLNTAPISAQLKPKKSNIPSKAAPPKAAPEPVDDKESAVIVEKLLVQSGQKYTSAGGGVWTINRAGKSHRYFQVLLYTAPGTLSTEIIVPRGKSAHSLNDIALDLLRLASRLNYVKIGIDKDDLFVRNEARLKSLNVEELNDNIDKVVAAADMVLQQVNTIN